MTKWPNQIFTARCCNLAFSCGRTLLHLNITQYKSETIETNTSIHDNSSLKPLPHQSGVLTAFTQRSKNCRTPRCALCSRHQRCVRAVCALFNHIERHAAAFVLCMLKINAAAWHLHSVLDSELWERCGNAVGSSRAPWARCGRAACTL